MSEPKEVNSPGKIPKKGSCAKLIVLVTLCGVALAVLCVFLIDVTNSGDRVKRLIVKALNVKQPEPPKPPKPPAPEVKIVEKIVKVPVEKIVEKIVEVKPPMPSKYVDWKTVDTAKLWNGINVVSEVDTEQGKSASVEREDPNSYRLEVKLSLTTPSPASTLEDLTALNPHLPKMLKDFPLLMKSARVSPFYHYLYELKTTRIQQNATRLDRVLSRHNLYDCETVLELTHPVNGGKSLLIQGEMDVVSDGSDGDRWPEMDDYISMSDHYQPFTSYGWVKKTDTPNPLLKKWEDKLKKAEKEFAIPGLSIARNRELRNIIETCERGVADMKNRSFLIAEADPFIVVPLSFLGRKEENPFGPAIGDYAVVIYQDKLFPAIVGDAGPSYKCGEASLRIAREISDKAGPYNRPVSDLKVTYLVFPDSADPVKAPPDLEAWRSRCEALLKDSGGLGEGYQLHHWEDLIAKKRDLKDADEKEKSRKESKEEPDGIEADDTKGSVPPVKNPNPSAAAGDQ